MQHASAPFVLLLAVPFLSDGLAMSVKSCSRAMHFALRFTAWHMSQQWLVSKDRVNWFLQNIKVYHARPYVARHPIDALSFRRRQGISKKQTSRLAHKCRRRIQLQLTAIVRTFFRAIRRAFFVPAHVFYPD